MEPMLGEDALGGGEDGGAALLFLALAPGGGGRSWCNDGIAHEMNDRSLFFGCNILFGLAK